MNILKEFPRLIDSEFSPIKGIKAKLNLKTNTQPVFLRSRTIPFQIKDKVEAELDRMVGNFETGCSVTVGNAHCAGLKS